MERMGAGYEDAYRTVLTQGPMATSVAQSGEGPLPPVRSNGRFHPSDNEESEDVRVMRMRKVARG